MADQNSQSDPGGSGTNSVTIIVIVVVALVFILILIGCIVFLCLRRRGFHFSSLIKQRNNTEDNRIQNEPERRLSSRKEACPSISLDLNSPVCTNPNATSPIDDDQSRGSIMHTASLDSGFQSYTELSARELARGVYSDARTIASTESINEEFDQVDYNHKPRISSRDPEYIVPVNMSVQRSAPPSMSKSKTLRHPDETRPPEHRYTYHEDMEKNSHNPISRNSSHSLPSNSASAKRYLQSKALSTDSGIGSSNVSLRNSAQSIDYCRSSTLSSDSVFDSDVDGSNMSLGKKFQSSDSLQETKELNRTRNKPRPLLHSTESVSLDPPVDKNMMVKILTKQFERIIEAHNDQWRDTIFVTPNFAIGIFDQHGGHLTLPDKSVDLYIPPGALSRRQVVYICRCVEDEDNDDVIFYSPVVDCGPDGLKFNTPVILNIKHCAGASTNHTPQLTLARKGGDDETWDSGIEDDAYVSVQKQTCSMFIDHFTKYGIGVVCKECSGRGIVRERVGNNSFDSGYISPSVSKGDITNGDVFQAKKQCNGAEGGEGYATPGMQARPVVVANVPDKLLYLCCYLQYQGVNMSVMRIYFLNKEEGMLNSLEARESMCDGKLGSPPQEFLFRPTDDLHVHVKSCVGCELQENGQEQVFDIEDVLNKSYGYVNFPIRITTKDANAFCNVEVFQPSRTKSRVPFTAIVNNWDKRSLEVDDLLKRFTELVNPRRFQHDQVLSFLQDANLLPATKHRGVFPRDMRSRLSLMLDTTNSTLCDWRGLAEVIGMDPESITWMHNNNSIISKTEMTLSFYENKCHFEGKIAPMIFADIANALDKIGHGQGYQLVKRYIEDHGFVDSHNNDIPRSQSMARQNAEHPGIAQASSSQSRDTRTLHNHRDAHIKSRQYPSAIPEESETESVAQELDLPPVVTKPKGKTTRRQESGYGSMSDNGYVMSVIENGNTEDHTRPYSSAPVMDNANGPATMV